MAIVSPSVKDFLHSFQNGQVCIMDMLHRISRERCHQPAEQHFLASDSIVCVCLYCLSAKVFLFFMWMKHFTFQEHSLFVLLSNTRIRSLYFIPKLKKYICEQSCRCSLLPYIGLCVCSYTSMLEGGIKFTGMSIL